ncbi:MAG: inositol monophosphatase [Bacteroidales bacterium]|nr:inositol monophosphatase [Bacteroidales bacterium]
MNLEKICFDAQKIIRKTGKYIIQESKNFNTDKVETKGLHDFVSFVDKNAEQQLVTSLKQLLPDAGFIAEEQTETFRSDKYNWVIDPLDGTTNFIHGLMPYAISVALMDKDELVLGIIYELSRSEMFYAWSGSKAFLNGKEISVTKTSKVQDSLIATGFPYYDYARLPQFMKTLDYFMRNSHGLRRLGSAATDLAYVACGRFDAFYEYSLSPWDVAAGAFIVMQAGGKVCDFSGGSNYIFGKEIIAANPNIYQEFLNEIKRMMEHE